MIYFDNAASTKPTEDVVQAYAQTMVNAFANPSGTSILAMEGEKIIKASAEKIARLINGNSSEEIYFTSGGTESNNMAILGVARAYHRIGKHIITTRVEHPAVTKPFEALAEEGFLVDYLEVDEKGHIRLEDLKAKITKETILVSTIYINNETGTIHNVAEIGKVIKEANPNTFYHVDGVQAFGKEKIDVQKSKIDMLSASGHKFHAPKGVGFLYIKKGVRVKPILFGGGQQNSFRSGTENVAGAQAIALAAEESYKVLEDSKKKVRAIKEYLTQEILSIPDTFINGESMEAASPYVLNVGFKNLRSPILLNALEDKGIYLSAGSACNSKKKVQSLVLEAMGLEEEDINGSIRLSFSRFNTLEEAEKCVLALKELVPMLRRFNRKR